MCAEGSKVKFPSQARGQDYEVPWFPWSLALPSVTVNAEPGSESYSGRRRLVRREKWGEGRRVHC